MKSLTLFCLIGTFIIGPSIAFGQIFTLQNHPDGNAAPPEYGMRLDGMLNLPGSPDIFTFSFEEGFFDPSTGEVNGGATLTHFDESNSPDGTEKIVISGTVFGGFEGGTNNYLPDDGPVGWWDLSFTYSDINADGTGDLITDTVNSEGVTGWEIAPGDLHLGSIGYLGNDPLSSDPDQDFTLADGSEFTLSEGSTWELRDKSNGSFSFAFAPDGHRIENLEDFVGRGWMEIKRPGSTDFINPSGSDDFLFLGGFTSPVPEPATVAYIAMGFLGGFLVLRNFKKKKTAS